LNRKAFNGPAPPLVVHGFDGVKVIACTDLNCRGSIRNIGWDRDGREILFMRREGAALDTRAIYAWSTKGNVARRIYATNGLLDQCHALTAEVICFEETATAPRRLIAIQITDGQTRTLFDPNPDFGEHKFGTVTRVYVTTKFGHPAFADVVLPTHYEPTRHYPAILLPYLSEGFLRGGVGDELPIHALSNLGFVVISLTDPFNPGAIREKNQRQLLINQQDTEKLDLASATLALLGDPLIARAVDRRRLGVWGLSNGASSAMYYLENTSWFSCASITSIPRDFMTYYLWGDGNREVDRVLSHATGDDFEHWRYFDWAVRKNLRNIRAPILVQTSDHELISSLEGFVTLHVAKHPVEMYVFPDEWHVKSHPAHRLAAYERNIDWFRFWLQNYEDPSPSKLQQYLRWRELRKQEILLQTTSNSSR